MLREEGLRESRIVTGIEREDISRPAVARHFTALLDSGARLRPAGLARHDPAPLLKPARLPRHMLRLFDATYFLGNYRYNEALGFFIAYVALPDRRGRVQELCPRIFYKDSSLVWRVASHFVHDHEEYWIGKGDVKIERRADGEHLSSAEETTNLPFEIQAALDGISRRSRRRRDNRAIELVLREAPSGRIEPYADFTRPRRRAAALHRVNGGRRVARFLRKGDPESLRFARGFEPDFRNGLLEESVSVSKFYGGDLRKIRVLSRNGKIQYFFMESPTHTWLNPPQTLTTALSSFGVRLLDVLADDDLFVPGYEYHEDDDDSQIPSGFAGAPHPNDPHRSDASAWVHALPVIREFQRVLGRR